MHPALVSLPSKIISKVYPPGLESGLFTGKVCVRVTTASPALVQASQNYRLKFVQLPPSMIGKISLFRLFFGDNHHNSSKLYGLISGQKAIRKRTIFPFHPPRSKWVVCGTPMRDYADKFFEIFHVFEWSCPNGTILTQFPWKFDGQRVNIIACFSAINI